MRKKQTKIVATISDRNCSRELLTKLYNNGMNVVRINTAHQTPDVTKGIVENVRAVAEDIAILIDTKGPEVRTRRSPDGYALHTGQKITLAYGPAEAIATPSRVYVSFDGFTTHITKGTHILIDDGAIALRVTKIIEQDVHCIVENGGTLKSRKGVNIPGVRMDLPALTKKDKEYLRFAIEHDIDFIAHSFVRNAKDIHAIRRRLGYSPVKIIAKIENKEGYDNINDILPEVYGIMVARGDLAVEVPFEQVPAIQKRLIRKAIQWGKPVITATQMLHSMCENIRPTRAEISDVANAIYDGSDAIMLSTETAAGRYPAEAVQVMSRIAKEVEQNKKAYRKNRDLRWKDPVHKFFGRSAISACAELPAKAIITFTRSGATARLIAAYRGRIPIHAKAMSMRTMRELALVYGVYPTHMDEKQTIEEMICIAVQDLLKKKAVGPHDLIVIVGSMPGDGSGADFLEIKTAEICLKHYR